MLFWANQVQLRNSSLKNVQKMSTFNDIRIPQRLSLIHAADVFNTFAFLQRLQLRKNALLSSWSTAQNLFTQKDLQNVTTCNDIRIFERVPNINVADVFETFANLQKSQLRKNALLNSSSIAQNLFTEINLQKMTTFNDIKISERVANMDAANFFNTFTI